jgi:hypothetical protein
MTDEQYTRAQRYIVRTALEAGVDISNPDAVIRYLLENPLPEDYETQTDTQDEDDKQARIIALRAELAKLEGR